MYTILWKFHCEIHLTLEVELHAAQHIPYDGDISFSYDHVKTCFKNSDYLTENLLRRMELFKLPILESGDLKLKECAIKIFAVLIRIYLYIYTYR